MAFTVTSGYTFLAGEEATSFKLNKLGGGTIPDGGSYLFANTGLSAKDTSGNFSLGIVPGSVLTAARTLSLVTGDGNRTVTLTGDPTLADWFDQSVKTTASPSFNRVTSTVATGTAPFTVASTTVVANLNASSLGGATFASPGAIGGTTPSTAAFTLGSYSGVATFSHGNGGNTTGSTNAAIYLSTDESTIQGPGTNTQIRMGGNLVVGAEGTMFFQTTGGTRLTLNSTTFTLASGLDLQLGKAYSAGVIASTGTITIKDNTGTVYKVLVST